jgi:cystathionine gamma-synthase
MTSEEDTSNAMSHLEPAAELCFPLGDGELLQAHTPIDEQPLAALDRELRADAARRVRQAMERMDRYLRREDSRRLGELDPTRVLAQALIEHGRSLLQGPLRPDASLNAESTLRSAYRLLGSLTSLAAWSAPASQESCAMQSFPVATPRDTVTYARYGCPDTAVQELAYAAQLGLNPATSRVLLTSSGMAAYALIENFLLRQVLGPQDRVLLDPGVYFESQQQLKTLPFMNIVVAAGGTRAHILEAIAAHQPKVIFVDPLTNCAELNLIDMRRLLDVAAPLCRQETWFIVDGTLLSGGFDPFAPPRPPHVRVLYYESACKYLQCGMDLGPAGVVVVEPSLAQPFEQLRRGIGAIAAEPIILPRVSRGAYLSYLRAQTACAAATARAVGAFARRGGASRLAAIFPGAVDHPDHADSFGYDHLGGLVAFRFLDARLNRRPYIERFIDGLIVKARAAKLPLTAGVSFGFRVPRITAAWSSYDSDRAFLRLSAGVDTRIAQRLGRLIAEHSAEAAL